MFDITGVDFLHQQEFADSLDGNIGLDRRNWAIGFKQMDVNVDSKASYLHQIGYRVRQQVHRDTKKVENCYGNKGCIDVQNVFLVAEQEESKREAGDQKRRQSPC